jgi:hypothetical protein
VLGQRAWASLSPTCHQIYRHFPPADDSLSLASDPIARLTLRHPIFPCSPVDLFVRFPTSCYSPRSCVLPLFNHRSIWSGHHANGWLARLCGFQSNPVKLRAAYLHGEESSCFVHFFAVSGFILTWDWKVNRSIKVNSVVIIVRTFFY